MSVCIIACKNVNNFYNMRNSHDFALISYRTNIREQCICVVGPRLWDSIPSDLRVSDSVFIFKRLAREYLISLY